jgi:hypothetical protein
MRALDETVVWADLRYVCGDKFVRMVIETAAVSNKKLQPMLWNRGCMLLVLEDVDHGGDVFGFCVGRDVVRG